MADHVINLQCSRFGMFLICSCGLQREVSGWDSAVELDELNRLAHEHIESAEHIEAAEQGGWPARPENPDISPVYVGQAYGAESAVTSEDELVDLAAEGRSGAIGLG